MIDWLHFLIGWFGFEYWLRFDHWLAQAAFQLQIGRPW